MKVLWFGCWFDLQCIQQFQTEARYSCIHLHTLNYAWRRIWTLLCALWTAFCCFCVLVLFLIIYVNNQLHWKKRTTLRTIQPLRTKSLSSFFAFMLCRWHTATGSQKQSRCITCFFLKCSFIFPLWSVTHFALFHPRPVMICYFSAASAHCGLLFPSSYTQLCLCCRPPSWGQTLLLASHTRPGSWTVAGSFSFEGLE